MKKSTVLQAINKFVKVEELESDFLELRNTSCCKKFAYPFKAPVLVLTGFGYVALLLGFMTSAAVAVDETGAIVVQVLNGGGWAFYYIVVFVVSVVANVYMFIVAALWVVLVLLVIIFIAFVVALLILAILCICCVVACTGTADTDH